MGKRVSDVITERLRKLIITEELTPGSMVSEAYLSDLLHCTRTPLRRALDELSHHYLVEAPARRGILIPQLSVVDYQQLVEAQVWLGTHLAGIVAARIDERQLKQLRDTVAEQEKCNRQRDFYRLTILDGQFHTLMIEAAGNRYFTGFSRQLRSSLARFQFRAYKATGSADLSIREHLDIIEALESRNPELARSRVKKHVTEAPKRVLNIIALGDHSQGA